MEGVALGACSDTALAPDTSLEVPSTADQKGVAPEEARGPQSQKPSDQTIAQIAEAAGFNLLLAAVDYIATTNPGSELVEGLLNDDQYTVFAPTDQAFLDLVNAVAPLLDPEILEADGPFAAIDDLLGAGTIENVVAYHVTEGRRGSNSVVPKNRDRVIETLLEGFDFSVTNAPSIVAIGNTANFNEVDGELQIDISASNGIIHAITAVILPTDLGL
ncbi:MAG: fasciclin domain-containing protein [Gemmatimonadota bacterium]